MILRLVIIGALAASACSGEADLRTEPTAEGPYVVTAIDYHFHDAHPSEPIQLGRAVDFNNQGENLHNVTFEELDFDENLPKGERISIDPVSDLVEEPGRYAFFCKFHADRGMTGVLVVVD